MYLKWIPMKMKATNDTVFRDASGRGVMPTIRVMQPGEQALFPFDFREAVRTACCLLRQREGLRAKCKVLQYEGNKYYHVTVQS